MGDYIKIINMAAEDTPPPTSKLLIFSKLDLDSKDPDGRITGSVIFKNIKKLISGGNDYGIKEEIYTSFYGDDKKTFSKLIKSDYKYIYTIPYQEDECEKKKKKIQFINLKQ